MHNTVAVYVARAVADFGPFTSVCEIGSRDVNGGIRHLFGPVRYVGVDPVAGPDVDVVADFADWDTDERFHCVVTTSALEHTSRARDLIVHAADILERPGFLIVTCAGPGWPVHSMYDGGPVLRPGEHYENVSAETLEQWMVEAEFDGCRTQWDPASTDTCGVAWLE